jgi:hypothetical protein
MKSVHTNNELLFEKYLRDAKTFWEVNLQIRLRTNARLIPAARWAVNETTSDQITIEHCSEDFAMFPEWAIRAFAFHEICHVKQAMEGLPLISYESEKENARKKQRDSSMIQISKKFNVCELDIEKLSHGLEVEMKDAVVLLQDAYVMGTDFLVNSELIKASPVSFDNIKVGMVTITGDQKSLRNPSTRLGSVIEAGLWHATIANVGSAAHSGLAEALMDHIRSFRETAHTDYGLNTESYQDYLNALSSMRFAPKCADLLFLIERIIRAMIPIMNETNSILDFDFPLRRRM